MSAPTRYKHYFEIEFKIKETWKTWFTGHHLRELTRGAIVIKRGHYRKCFTARTRSTDLHHAQTVVWTLFNDLFDKDVKNNYNKGSLSVISILHRISYVKHPGREYQAL